MSKKVGILLDSATGDLQIKGKSLVVGHSLYQNQYMILKAQRGDIKEHPNLGVGIDDLANDNNIAEWKLKIREEFKKDDLRISQLDIKNNELIIKADYE